MGTEPQIIAQYIKTGRARLVYRHLLQLGEGSRVLAEASECAGAQGQFWPFRALLYWNQDQLGDGTDVGQLRPLEDAVKLDHAAFQQCMDTHRFQQQVDADYAASQREGIESRPTLLVNGAPIIGSQPFEVFAKAIDAAH